MFAVSGTKSIVHIAVSIRSEGLGELFLACLHCLFSLFVSGILFLNTNGFAFLFAIEAEVLKHQHFAGLEGISLCFCFSTVRSELHLHAECSAYGFYNLAQAELSVHFAFRFAHVAHDDQRTTLVEDVLESRQRTTDTGVVCNLSILVQWHIKVHTYNRFLACEFVIFDCHNCKFLVSIQFSVFSFQYPSQSMEFSRPLYASTNVSLRFCPPMT